MADDDGDEEDEQDDVELPELSFDQLLAPYMSRPMADDAPTGLATELSSSLRTLRKMLRKHLQTMAVRGEQVRMVRGSGGELYPEWQFAAGFATRLLTWRERQSHATRRSGFRACGLNSSWQSLFWRMDPREAEKKKNSGRGSICIVLAFRMN